MRAFIMAAGEGTRMWPITEGRPKPLTPLLGKSILEYILDAVIDAGIEHISILVGRDGRKIVSAIGHSYRGTRIEYRHQERRLGTGNAALYAEEFPDEIFMFINGDIVFDPSVIEEMKGMESAVLGVFRENAETYGILEGDEHLSKISEKVKGSRNRWVNAGVYVFGRKIFDAIRQCTPSKRGEIELTDAINLLASDNEVRIVKSDRFWMDIGFPWDILNALPHLMENMMDERKGIIEDNVIIKGPVRVGEGSLIRSGTYIEGPVYIGKNTVIGPSAYLRPYTVIGDDCHIGNSSEVKASLIMNGTKVPHFNYIGDSVIGEKCNFGAGTKVANLRLDEKNISVNIRGERIDTGRRKLGVIMGDGVHTGINSSIYPGTLVGTGARIGPGAKVKGRVDSGTTIM